MRRATLASYAASIAFASIALLCLRIVKGDMDDDYVLVAAHDAMTSAQLTDNEYSRDLSSPSPLNATGLRGHSPNGGVHTNHPVNLDPRPGFWLQLAQSLRI